MTHSREIRLLLVDDLPAVRRGLRMWLSLEPDMIVVGEAGDGAEVCPLVNALHPDVVLMDLFMPHRDGLCATADVHLAHPGLPVVLLSLYDDRETRDAARHAGVTAFVAKHDLDHMLVRTIRAVAGRCAPGA
jgi:DNA-binding NarL/FixJ family response regulator